MLVALLDQQPGFLGIARCPRCIIALASLHANQRPAAVELFAEQFKLQLAGPQACSRVSHRHPDAAIPDDDMAGAILSLRNKPLEAGVRQWMVFDMHAHAFDARVQARTLGHRPALQGSAQFQPEVVVQIACCMSLNHKTEGSARLAGTA